MYMTSHLTQHMIGQQEKQHCRIYSQHQMQPANFSEELFFSPLRRTRLQRKHSGGQSQSKRIDFVDKINVSVDTKYHSSAISNDHNYCDVYLKLVPFLSNV